MAMGREEGQKRKGKTGKVGIIEAGMTRREDGSRDMGRGEGEFEDEKKGKFREGGGKGEGKNGDKEKKEMRREDKSG